MVRPGRIPQFFSVFAIAILCARIGDAQVLSSPKLLPGTTHSPDDFGIQDYTVTMIPAVAFTPKGDNFGAGEPVFTTGDNLARWFYLNEGQLGEFYAPVNVPAGAVIDYIGLNFWDPVGGLVGVALYLVNGDGSKGWVGGFSSFADPSFAQEFNATPLGFQVNSNANYGLVLNVEMATDGQTMPAFLWVNVRWRRAVSWAPETASFNDVPTNHPFFRYIEALKASGITGGCQANPPLYCPDNPVTRGQMAVFLAKALGLYWPN